MNNGFSFAEWRDKVGFWAVTFFAATALTWGGFITQSLAAKPSKEEVREMVALEQRLTEEQILHLKDLNNQWAIVVKENTDAINDLRVELALQRGKRLED